MRTLVTAAVRAPPILATVALLFGAPGCGRFGYLPMPVDVDADAGPGGDAQPGQDGVDPDGTGSPEIGGAGDGPTVTSDADASPPEVPAEPCQKLAIATGQDGAEGIFVDATHVYWTNSVADQVMRAPIAGGPPELIAAGQDNAIEVVADATTVYVDQLRQSTRSGAGRRAADCRC